MELPNEENFKYLSQAIQRTIDVLLAFTNEHPEWTLSELSEAIDMPKSALFRSLVNLESRGLLEHDEQSGRYRLGMRLFELGMRAWRSADLQTIAHPYLEELARETGEMVTLAVLSDDEVLYVDKIDSSKTIRAVSNMGQRRPVYCTAVGKVLMADQPADEVLRVLREKGMSPRTPKTITDPEHFLEDLERTRKLGYSLDMEEFEEELSCVATPVIGANGRVVASIGVSGPATRFNDGNWRRLLVVTRATALEVSRKLGYVEPAAIS